jgi:hypothetical protein
MNAEFVERLSAARDALERVAECRLSVGDLDFRALARGIEAVRCHAESDRDNHYRSLFFKEVLERKDAAVLLGQKMSKEKAKACQNAAWFRRWHSMSKLEHETIAREALERGIVATSERYKVPQKAIVERIGDLKKVRRGRPKKTVQVEVREVVSEVRARRRRERLAREAGRSKDPF